MKKLVICLIAVVALLASSVQAGVVGYWRFEGDSTGFVADSSGNSHTLTTKQPQEGGNNPTQITLPSSGAGSTFQDPIPQTSTANAKASSFDTTDFFSVSDHADFTVSDFTIEAYVNVETTTDLRIIASQYGFSSQRSWYFARLANGNLGLVVSDDGDHGVGHTETIESSYSLTAGTDYYVAVSFDLSDTTSGGVKFYCQNLTDSGSLQTENGQHTWTVLHDSTSAFNIGAYGDQHNASDWVGLLDEVRFSDTVLSQDDLLSVPEPVSASILLLGAVALLRRRKK